LTASVDSTADTARSIDLLMFSWAWFILYFFFTTVKSPIVIPNDCPTTLTGDNTRTFITCTLIVNLLSWILKCGVAIVVGISCVVIPNIGNYSRSKNPGYAIIAFSFTVFMSTVDLFEASGAMEFILNMVFILAILIMVRQAYYIVGFFIPKHMKEQNPWLGNLVEADGVKLETRMKRSAAHKMNRMVKNAVEISKTTEGSDNVMDTYFGQGLLGFAKAGEKVEKSGGFVWTIKSMKNGTLERTEGLWVSAKVRANWFSMLCIAIFIAIFSTEYTVATVRALGKENIVLGLENRLDLIIDGVSQTILTFFDQPSNQTSVILDIVPVMVDFALQSKLNANISCPDLEGSTFSCGNNCSIFDSDFVCALTASEASESTLGLLEAAGFNASAILGVARETAREAVLKAVDKLYPSNGVLMIALPMITFNVVSFIVVMFFALIYFPSVVTTTLKLRTGVIPTFSNPRFASYRASPDKVSTLSGSCFWGTIISSLLLGILSGIGVFLIVWQVTRPIVIRICAIVIGIAVTVTIKTIFLTISRKFTYRGFYRRKPGRASFINVISESVDFALSIYFTIVRLAKVILIGLLYIGRIDTPLFAPEIPVAADPTPFVFVKDILAHEAHRHPLLSLMGTFYVMKLTYKDEFVNRAGSAWRLIFVYALFPWLSTYRIDARGDNDDEEELEKENTVVDLSTFRTLRSDYLDKVAKQKKIM